MSKAKLIAFYLPQYHPIPENDEWWGSGFTDWVNVAKARPRFKGHNQPQIPADLGFYDLRHDLARIAQAEMASEYGVYGFCYYHYWFNEKMLLDLPFNEVLKTGEPDFPFCLCWANENWTRRWDGLDAEILIQQDYEKYDPEKHIIWLERAFRDKRYIRINGKPLFIIYRPDSIKGLKDIITFWRNFMRNKGYEGIYLCAVKSSHNELTDEEMINMGFDALVDFFPHNNTLPWKDITSLPKYYFSLIINRLITLSGLINKIRKLPVTLIYSYEKMVKIILNRPESKYKTFPCVIPGWDNTARKRWATIIQNNDVNLYEKWLRNTIAKIKKNDESEQIIFINAWNEWAEGCHLEPDLIFGKKFLEATQRAVGGTE